ncbi:MAG: ATP-binding protein [Anaerolineales bacterium]
MAKFTLVWFRWKKIELDGEPAFIASTIDITELKNAEEAILTANEMLRNYATELETLTNRLMLAARVSRSAGEELDPEKLSELVVRTIQNEFELYYVGLFLCDSERKWAELRAATGAAGKKLLQEKHHLAIDENSMIGWSIVHRQPRIALDVGEDAVRFENPLLPDTRSELALPLISRNEVIGALSIQSTQERAFTNENITWMQNLADLLANALANARLYDALEKELKERQQAEAEVRKLNEELEERVRQRTARLEAANKELEAFSYSVSHDLRAPLRSVDGFSRILMDDFSEQMPEEARRYVRIIRESAQKMGQLIEDILRLSRISRTELRIETFDLSVYAAEIAQRLQSEMPERQAVINIQSPLLVTADRNLLIIVLENLLSNAWKFTGKKEHAEISVGMLQQDDDQVLYVKDNGVGFNMDYAEKLFGAFQRLHSDQDFPGTGIGLAIVQRIINRHGGRIWAESEPDKGTTFYFTLSE